MAIRVVLAFSTTELVPRRMASPFLDPRPVVAEAHPLMDALFQAAVEAVEEAVINALLRAETVVGRAGHMRHALPLDPVLDLLERAARHRG